MLEQDWLITGEGLCLPMQSEKSDDSKIATRPYRLYRFLTDIEDIVAQETDDRRRLMKICPLVRRLLNSCEWLQINFSPPDPKTGWSVQTLYDEPDFLITIQTVAWAPRTISPIHNHATWGIVALLDGQEKNNFWQRSPTTEFPDLIKPTGSRLFTPGDILCFLPNAIHQIEAIGQEPTISFNLYGETNYDQRFEFDTTRSSAQIF